MELHLKAHMEAVRLAIAGKLIDPTLPTFTDNTLVSAGNAIISLAIEIQKEQELLRRIGEINLDDTEMNLESDQKQDSPLAKQEK